MREQTPVILTKDAGFVKAIAERGGFLPGDVVLLPHDAVVFFPEIPKG